MRRCSIVALIVVGACTVGTYQGTTTDVTPAASSSTTSTVPPTTASTVPATTTTTLPTTTTIPVDQTVIAYRSVAAMDFPVQMTARPGDSLSYVITKAGRVWVYDGSAVSETPVLDIADQVRDSGEQGLLSIALHPTEDRLYLHYSDNNGDTVVSEFTLTSPTEADPSSERELLQVDQPAANHNGGMLLFAPGGEALLLGLGDGGGADDRFGNGQNPDTLLAGLVQLWATGGPEPVKYEMGLRNPWRFWIDNDLIYIADVGQDEFEEVDVVPLAPNQNFGWPITEGLHCFQARAGSCDTTDLVIPVIEVEHGDAGTCSITGGIVYRGPAMPQLNGHYFYSDYCGGYLRSFLYAGGDATEQIDWTEQVGVPGPVTGFGVDGAGEMYVTTTGELLQVAPAG